MRYRIYTDGSCRNNGKHGAAGAYGYVILNEFDTILHEDYVGELGTTNQRMELFAAAAALEWLQANTMRGGFDVVEVYTDSAYLHNCYTERWYINWQRNGWVNKNRDHIKNDDLWRRLIPFFEDDQTYFYKVKGHDNDEWNNYVDRHVQAVSGGM